MTRILHFTLGPVQGFIEDARRTRDLWAGSFLLSLLSGHAMAAIHEMGGRVLFPQVDGDPLFEAIRNSNPDADVYVGTLPNRFKAEVTACPPDIATLCRNRIQEKWKLICDAVWAKFLAPHADKGSKISGSTPREIWDRQTLGFWDIAWVEGNADPRGGDSRWLDLRKNWRSHHAGFNRAEGGDHCRLMGEFQELSGHQRTTERDQQKAFWNAAAQGQGLDLSADEPLCSIALVKRLFPRLGQIPGAIDWQPGGKHLSIRNWPSVSYIAAVPWLRCVLADGLSSITDAHFETADKRLGSGFLGETETRLFDLPGNRKFFSLDGMLLHQDGIAGTVSELIAKDRPQERSKAVDALTQSLRDLINETKAKTGVPAASKFYAILKMDGDSIGKALSEDATSVKAGLFEFARRVIKTFQPGPSNRFNGVLIYAGGDDVLALLPIDTAIDCALHLRETYGAAFRKVLAGTGSTLDPSQLTLSGAIIFSQFKVPLRAALEKARHYLDTVAKDENGRDSLAIAVLRPGGVSTDWVSTFGDPVSESKAARLMEVATSQAAGADEADFSGGFFHTLKERYLPLFSGHTQQTAGEDGAPDQVFVDPDFMKAIVTTEYRKQLGARNRDTSPTEVENAIRPILEAATPERKTKEHARRPSRRGFDFEAGLVIRFLAMEGRQPRKTEAAP